MQIKLSKKDFINLEKYYIIQTYSPGLNFHSFHSDFSHVFEDRIGVGSKFALGVDGFPMPTLIYMCKCIKMTKKTIELKFLKI